MLKGFIRYVSISLLIMVLALPANAQRKSSVFKPFTIGAGSGTSHYFGDIVDDFYWTVNGQFTVSGAYHLHPRIHIGLEYTFFRLKAHDKNSEIKELRNLSFFSNNNELALIANIPLFEIPHLFYERKRVNPYLIAGVSFLNFVPKAEYQGEKYFLRPLKTEGVSYSPFTVTVPLGAGIFFKLNAFMDISVSAAFRFSWSDYLDDVSSGIYPDPDSFEDPIARALSDRSGEIGVNPPFAEEPRQVRGNPDENDNYFLVHGKILFYLSPVRDASRVIRYQGTRKKMKKRRR
jgi:hypothetical protein